jgi:RNA polymerase sigma factor (sigma-70 family)
MRPSDNSSSSNSAELLDRLVAGDQKAADEIFTRYVERLTRLARSRLAARLAARVDPEDIVMSAYRSFFVGAREGRFSITHGGDLWRLLVEVVLHKLYRTAERHLAQQRSVTREERIHDAPEAAWQTPSREPTPDEALAAADELAAILSRLGDRNRQILELRLQGYEHEEIAERLTCSQRTVRRAIHEARRIILARGGQGFVPTAARRRPPASSAAARRFPMPALSELTAPLNWTDFALQEQVGAGATGRVFKALDRRTENLVAIKFLRKSLIGDTAAMARFLQEAQTVAGLEHPAIVKVHGAGRTPGGGLFLVMDFVDGLDLDKLRRKQPVDLELCLRWTLEAARAIDAAHQLNVIHCDIKPSNVLLGHDGKIRVTDFGLAVRLDIGRPSAFMAGTPAFMAPEQIDSCWGEISPATDVWGLGSLLYFLLFSQPPFRGDDVPATLANVVAKTPVKFLPVGGAHVPMSVLEVLRHSLAKSPADRIASADQFVSAVSRLL